MIFFSTLWRGRTAAAIDPISAVESLLARPVREPGSAVPDAPHVGDIVGVLRRIDRQESAHGCSHWAMPRQSPWAPSTAWHLDELQG
jgi:hypothetical protein